MYITVYENISIYYNIKQRKNKCNKSVNESM